MHRNSLHKAYPYGALAEPAPRVPCAKRCTGGAQPMNNRGRNKIQWNRIIEESSVLARALFGKETLVIVAETFSF